MKEMRSLMDEITNLTYEIESHYPELYQYLEEDPLTILASKSPILDQRIMSDYLESLQELLKHHLETHTG
ncbi:MAG: hypothetical protein ACR2MX_09570 [Cyclobacteriaceae bacterium]